MADLRGTELYFDCFSGIAGDMTLGALLDLGVPEAAVRAELDKLPIKNYRFARARVRRGALVGTKVDVLVDEHERGHDHDHDHDHAHDHDPRHREHAHRHYRDIKAMLESHLGGDVLGRALAIFDRIAVVEARLHGVSVEEVAFHEVGAVDSIVDIVGAAAALAWLQPSRVTARPVPLGGGSVDTAHGRLPVPAPATLELLAGVPVEAGGDKELTTPTGAAILAASCSAFGPMPPLAVAGVGWGAGTLELPDRPNLLRVVAGTPASLTAAAGEMLLVEANIDDMNPELCEPLLEALFAAGAVDAWLVPIVMKKSRPAFTVAALCAPAAKARVEAALFAESTTIGVRSRLCDRTVLPRRFVDVDTPFGKVPIKVSTHEGLETAAPEYEACRRLAKEAGIPVRRVYDAALAAFFRR